MKYMCTKMKYMDLTMLYFSWLFLQNKLLIFPVQSSTEPTIFYPCMSIPPFCFLSRSRCFKREVGACSKPCLPGKAPQAVQHVEDPHQGLHLHLLLGFSGRLHPLHLQKLLQHPLVAWVKEMRMRSKTKLNNYKKGHRLPTNLLMKWGEARKTVHGIFLTREKVPHGFWCTEVLNYSTGTCWKGVLQDQQ